MSGSPLNCSSYRRRNTFMREHDAISQGLLFDSFCDSYNACIITFSILRELNTGGTDGLDKEVHEGRDGLLARPVSLQLAQELHPRTRLTACLFDPPQGHLVRDDRDGADRVHHRTSPVSLSRTAAASPKSLKTVNREMPSHFLSQLWYRLG